MKYKNFPKIWEVMNLTSNFYPKSGHEGIKKGCPRTRNSPRTPIEVVAQPLLAEKMGFEPMLRYKRTTPLAGEPLEPLGYFSIALKFF